MRSTATGTFPLPPLLLARVVLKLHLKIDNQPPAPSLPSTFFPPPLQLAQDVLKSHSEKENQPPAPLSFFFPISDLPGMFRKRD